MLGTLAQVWLVERGALPRDAVDEALATCVAMAFRAATDAELGEAPPAHGPAAHAILNLARARGGIRPAGAGRWTIERAPLLAALRELASEVLAIHASGDRERARAFLARWGEPSPEVRAALERTAEIPLERYEARFELR